MTKKKIAVLGGGSWGSVLANLASVNGSEVVLWMRDKSLAESMDVYDLKIEEVFKRTRREVEKLTEGDQVPWESSSLLGDFYFNQF